MTARIVSPWVGNGSVASPYRPKLLDDHPLPPGGKSEDVTGQPVANIVPSPNLVTVEVRGVSQGWVDAVEADATYTVLWSE